jgi:glutamate dehydrogenase (NADP+)
MLLPLLLLLPMFCPQTGGVAVSGLEMAQNATMTTWSSEEVDNRLKVGGGGDSAY